MNPIVKWAGGKRQILNELIKRMPQKYNKYFEPFIGGGALFLSIAPKEAYISDLNEELLNVYRCLSDKDLFDKFKNQLNYYQDKHCESFYYEIREMDRNSEYNNTPIYIKAARMVYLNKAGYNGLYRVNSKGYFNVPFNKKEKVVLYDENNIKLLNEYFLSNKIEIVHVDFSNVLNKAKQGDFVYFDPPYDDLNNKTFTSYTENNFTKEDQIRLCNVAKELSNKGVFVMLSNHNTPFIQELYKDFKIEIINAKRMINSNASKRGFVEEVVIRNYE